MNAPVFNHAIEQYSVFLTIAEQLRNRGYCVIDDALSPAMAASLARYATELNQHNDLRRAGIGRGDDQILAEAIRKDSIHWLSRDNDAAAEWLDTMERMRVVLNQQLLLGLFSYESHIAHYSHGDFYRKHLDAFKGESNRILSTVYYLNDEWSVDNGGELIIYDENDNEAERVLPVFNRLVVFLSEEFPHEVRPSWSDRFSIAGWFRPNTSTHDRIDPPR